MDVSETNEFKKDKKKLCKRFKTLEEDLQIFSGTQFTLYHEHNIDNKGIFPIPNYNIVEPKIQVYKAKKFACRSIKGSGSNSGIRIIYAFNSNDDVIELLEIYFKGDKTLQNDERIKDYLKNKKLE